MHVSVPYRIQPFACISFVIFTINIFCTVNTPRSGVRFLADTSWIISSAVSKRNNPDTSLVLSVRDFP